MDVAGGFYMNTNQKLQRWLPCKSRCEMAGAASFFLSLKDCVILINGPRWCATIAEREMARVEKKYERRIFCSEVKEIDLLYGADDALLLALEEVKKECNPKMIAVINSCSVSLIGDDIQGICHRANLACEIIAVDAGGLKGEFWEGYQEALDKILDLVTAKVKVKKEVVRKNRVNLFGWCNNYPNWQGDLAEIKRMLISSGIEVGVCLGADETSLAEMMQLPLAACNIVLAPELGVEAAKRLAEEWGQDYLIAPTPYGMQCSIAWLNRIAEKLQINICTEKLETEIDINQEKLDQAIFQLKADYKNFGFGDVYLTLPYGVAYGIVAALKTEFPEFNDIYLKIEGPNKAEYPMIQGVRAWQVKQDTLSVEETGISLVLGDWQTRLEVGQYDRMIFKNFLMPMQGVPVAERPYAGVLGWKHFMAEVIEVFHMIAYLHPAKVEK